MAQVSEGPGSRLSPWEGPAEKGPGCCRERGFSIQTRGLGSRGVSFLSAFVAVSSVERVRLSVTYKLQV